MREVGEHALEAECIIRGRRVMRLVCNDACLSALRRDVSESRLYVVRTFAWEHPRVTRHGVYCACGAGVLEVEWARRGRCAVCYYEAHPHEGICAKCGEYLSFNTVGDLCNQCRMAQTSRPVSRTSRHLRCAGRSRDTLAPHCVRRSAGVRDDDLRQK